MDNIARQPLSSASLQSNVISFLRFPMIVGVVMIHSNLDDIVIDGKSFFNVAQFPIFENISFLISHILARIAVPLFFFISGFLFFKGDFTFDSYKDKLKRRAKTILLPYVLWNLFVLVLYLGMELYIPSLRSGRNSFLSYTPLQWLNLFWDGSGGFPICFQFWFLRDLMVVMVLSPIIFLGIRYLKCYFVLLLGIFWITNIWFDISGFSISAFFFFSAGAFFNITKINFVDFLKPLTNYSMILYIIICGINIYFRNEFMLSTGIIIGMVCAVTLTARKLEDGKWHVNNFLSESSFFIYAYHGTLIALLIKLAVKITLPDSEFELIAIYFLAPSFTILIGLGIYYLLKRYVPKFTSIITGGR